MEVWMDEEWIGGRVDGWILGKWMIDRWIDG